MRCVAFKILLLLLCSCAPSIPDQNIAKGENVMEEGQAQVAEEWDKHEFFDDLEWTTLDSLGKVIEIADSIVAYNWNGHNGNPASVHHHIVDAYGKFDEKVGNNIALNDFQKTTLKGLLIDSTNFEGNNSTCFIPHIAFVYYKESEIIGQSNVCFLCSGVKSVPKSTKALSSMGIRKLKDFCRKIGLEILDDASQLSR